MALALDGHAINTATSSTPTVTLTTTSTNDVIVLYIAMTTGTVSSVAGGGLTWAQRKGFTYSGSNRIETWYAIAATALSAVTITATLSVSATVTIGAFGVSGAATPTPWDTNASIPATSSGNRTTPSVGGVSTTATNTMLIGICGQDTNTAESAGGGATLIDSAGGGSNAGASEQKIVSTTQSGVSVSFGALTGNNWGMIADALAGATSFPPGNASTAIPWTLTWYRSVEYSNTFYLGKDTLPFRALQTLPPPPVTWYRNWPEETSKNLLLVNLPFNQYDWPLPKTAYWYRSIEGADNIYLNLYTLPFNQKDWPLPKTAYWYRSQETNHTFYLGFDILPKNQYDWPLPKSWWWDRFEGSNQGLYISASPVPPVLVFPHGRRLIPDFTKNAYIPYPIGLRF